jgi:uncharacterized protein (DUF433 family)
MVSNRKPIVNKPDIRSRPAYAPAEAARYLHVPPATLRSWVVGRRYATSDGSRSFDALLKPASRHPVLLSFWNLIECHVLRALRTEHGVPLREVRQALSYAERRLRITNLLLRRDLLTDGGRLFLERFGQLVDLSASGQLAMREVLEAHLRRVEWDSNQFPVRLYPYFATMMSESVRPIAIDPAVAFGRPIVARRGITTAILVERYDAGESLAEVAADYDLTESEVRQAIVYEQANERAA